MGPGTVGLVLHIDCFCVRDGECFLRLPRTRSVVTVGRRFSGGSWVLLSP